MSSEKLPEIIKPESTKIKIWTQNLLILIPLFIHLCPGDIYSQAHVPNVTPTPYPQPPYFWCPMRKSSLWVKGQERTKNNKYNTLSEPRSSKESTMTQFLKCKGLFRTCNRVLDTDAQWILASSKCLTVLTIPQIVHLQKEQMSFKMERSGRQHLKQLINPSISQWGNLTLCASWCDTIRDEPHSLLYSYQKV